MFDVPIGRAVYYGHRSERDDRLGKVEDRLGLRADVSYALVGDERPTVVLFRRERDRAFASRRLGTENYGTRRPAFAVRMKRVPRRDVLKADEKDLVENGRNQFLTTRPLSSIR